MFGLIIPCAVRAPSACDQEHRCAYDAQQGGYVVNLDKKQLEGAPNYDRDSEFKWTPDYGRKVDSYYKAPSYWM